MSKDAIRNDEEARIRIEQDLDTSFLVEAGAGSGKTTSLIARMLSLIGSGKAKVSNIAAITFTNKAAAELRGRFRLKLEAQLRGASDETVRKRYEYALEHINEGFIGTIHSFCGRLLRERPIEAGLDPLFQEIDEAQQKELLNRLWDDYLIELQEQGNEAMIDRISELGVHVEDLRAVFLCVAVYDDVHVFTQPVPRPDFDRLRLSLLPMLEEAISCMPSNPPVGGWDLLQSTLRNARAALRHKDMSNDLHVLDLSQMFDRTWSVTQKRWPDAAKARELKERFSEWRASVLLPFLQSWREYLHPQLVRFVLPAVDYCRRRRMEEGLLTFQDLLMKATELLRERPEARSYFAQRYTRLFVDEFQDTDPVQAEMMLLLTGKYPNEPNWRRQEPKAGSLFIVGDPKQSIYRFRRADISIYNFVKRMIGHSGDILQLTRNFRSVKAVGDFVNYAFESKFLPPGQPGDHQADYIKMLTNMNHPPGKGFLHGVYTLVAPKADRDKKADIAMEDAERVARWIAWACKGNLMIAGQEGGKHISRPARPDDFMILLKYREFIGLYAERLEQYGISADTSGSQVMYDELRALYLLALCLNDTTDGISLLAVLRGMFFGVSDDALYVYTKQIGRISLALPQKERTEIPETAQPVFDALKKLREFLERVRSEPALAALMWIVEEIGIIPYAAVQSSGTIRSGTAVKLLEIIGEGGSAAVDWTALTALLGDILKGNGIEGTSLFAGHGRAVRIMNLHKAKGLEAPVVFLACPCGDSDKDASEHIDRMQEPVQGYFTITRSKDAYNKEIIAQPVGWPELAEKERIYIHAERDRLLYVAATRAKQLLIVSRYPYKPAIDPWSSLDTELGMQRELDHVDVQPEPREKYAGSFNMKSASQEWNKRSSAALHPTYAIAGVTSQVKAGQEAWLTRPSEGRGAAFGTVVHRCLEEIGNGLMLERLEKFIRMAAGEAGMDFRWLDDAMNLIDRVIGSELWRRAMSAKRRFHEFTFTFTEILEGFDQLVNGVIDMVFEEEDGWVIVDFKTDAFEPENETQFIDYYRPQINAYARYWEQLMNTCEVKERGLYFINSDMYIVIIPEV